MENRETEKKPPIHKITMINRLKGICFYACLTILYHLRKIGRNASPVWWFAATIWGLVSYVIISDYLRYGDMANLSQIYLLCSLLWALFGFGAVFSSLMKNEIKRIPGCLFRAVFPPLVLHFVLFSIVKNGV